MTDSTNTDARTARVLSAIHQGLLTQEITGSDAAGADAFLTEFEAELTDAVALGQEALTLVYSALVGDTATAIWSVVQYVAPQVDRTPAELLRELIFVYEKAGAL